MLVSDTCNHSQIIILKVIKLKHLYYICIASEFSSDHFNRNAISFITLFLLKQQPNHLFIFNEGVLIYYQKFLTQYLMSGKKKKKCMLILVHSQHMKIFFIFILILIKFKHSNYICIVDEFKLV